MADEGERAPGLWGMAEGRPLAVAHRGASAYAPENTLPAFRLAVAQGARAIELDVHRSRDGQLIVCHDAALERTTDGRGVIQEQDLVQLRGYDAGYRFTPDGGATFPFRGRGIQLPTLAEVFELLPAGTLVNVELKLDPAGGAERREPLVGAFADFARARPELGTRILVSSFDHAAVDALRRLGLASLGVRTGYLVQSGTDLAAALRAVVAAGHQALHPHHSSLGEGAGAAALIAEAHWQGVAVNVWTVDDPERMHALAALGVDAIMSNLPDVLTRTLGHGTNEAALAG